MNAGTFFGTSKEILGAYLQTRHHQSLPPPRPSRVDLCLALHFHGLHHSEGSGADAEQITGVQKVTFAGNENAV